MGSALSGGLTLFGIVMIIGIVELLVVRKAYYAKILSQGIGVAARASAICTSAGGRSMGTCCRRPKRRISRSIKKCL